MELAGPQDILRAKSWVEHRRFSVPSTLSVQSRHMESCPSTGLARQALTCSPRALTLLTSALILGHTAPASAAAVGGLLLRWGVWTVPARLGEPHGLGMRTGGGCQDLPPPLQFHLLSTKLRMSVRPEAVFEVEGAVSDGEFLEEHCNMYSTTCETDRQSRFDA